MAGAAFPTTTAGAAAPVLRISPHADPRGLTAGQTRVGRLLLIPALVAFGLVILGPFLHALALSLFRDNLESPQVVFIGLANFRRILSDPAVIGSFVTTAIYVSTTTAFTMALGLAWALLMHQPFPGRGALRALSLLPWVLPSTVCAFVWAWIFNSRYGVLNAILLEMGLIDFPRAWLSTAGGAMAAIVITKVWLSIPLYMAFFLAGLQTLDKEQVEAARVDGAGNWAVLRDHVLPHLRPVVLVVAVLGMIGNLQQFDTIYALTGGGPVRATAVLSVEVYRRAFEAWDIGVASAIGVLWVATILPPAYLYLRQLLRST
ncbi:carbohydrate ABC transporter permease [Salinarimonas sp.]|uniref:carbohydrate ABC transporter permease n=1 Tax=Salinarimonas sp. TaxID=2766526 RepID=UPI00391B23A8